MDFNNIQEDNRIVDGYFYFYSYFIELKNALSDYDLKLVSIGCMSFVRIHDIEIRMPEKNKIIITYVDYVVDGIKTTNDVLYIVYENETIKWKFPHFSDNPINVLEGTIINKISKKYYDKIIVENANIDFKHSTGFGDVDTDLLRYFAAKIKYNDCVPKVLKTKHCILKGDDGLSKRIVRKFKQFGIKYLVKHLYWTNDNETIDGVRTFLDYQNKVIFKESFYNAYVESTAPYYEFVELVPEIEKCD